MPGAQLAGLAGAAAHHLQPRRGADRRHRHRRAAPEVRRGPARGDRRLPGHLARGPDHHARPRRLGHLAPSPSPRRSRPSAATSTPTSTASTPPTRASPARRASSSKIAYEEMLELASLGRQGAPDPLGRARDALQGAAAGAVELLDDEPGTHRLRRGGNRGITSGQRHRPFARRGQGDGDRRPRPPGHRGGDLRPAGRRPASTST